MKTWISTEREPGVSSGDGFPEATSRTSEIGQKAAAALDSAASSLHAKAESLPGGEQVARAAHATADALETTADYVADRELTDILADAQEVARRHPGAVLLTAAALGFLLARTLSRH